MYLDMMKMIRPVAASAPNSELRTATVAMRSVRGTGYSGL
jgi:hypothetical protein